MLQNPLSAVIEFLTMFLALYLALGIFERGRWHVNLVGIAGLMLPIGAAVLVAELWAWLFHAQMVHIRPRMPLLLGVIAAAAFMTFRYGIGLSRTKCAAYAALTVAALVLGFVASASLPGYLQSALQ